MLTKEDIRMIKFFYLERGDVTRYCNWEKIEPEVLEKCLPLRQALQSEDETKAFYEQAMLALDNIATED